MAIITGAYIHQILAQPLPESKPILIHKNVMAEIECPKCKHIAARKVGRVEENGSQYMIILSEEKYRKCNQCSTEFHRGTLEQYHEFFERDRRGAGIKNVIHIIKSPPQPAVEFPSMMEPLLLYSITSH